MQEHEEAMVKSLVAVAWADGRMDDEEAEVIEALIDTFEIQGADADALREYAKIPRTLEDVPLSDLSAHDRRMLLQHAVIISYVDGEQSEREREVLSALTQRLNLPEDEAVVLRQAAEDRAKHLLDLL